MIKGFLGSLIAAVVLFAAGGITVALFGTKPYEYSDVIEQVDRGYVDESFTGERTWNFGEAANLRHISVSSSSVKTYIMPSADGTLSVYAQSNGWKELSVSLTCDDGVLGISVGSGNEFGPFTFNVGNSGTVMISVPDRIYDSLALELGSGSLAARGIAAELNTFDIGSGSFEYEQKPGFTANLLQLDMGSGSAKIANAACSEYNILMGSGSFDVGGLTGSGKFDIGSGSVTAEFAKVNGSNLFDLGSGKLTAYIPGDTRADLFTLIGSGTVSVDCCGVSRRITDDQHITLNGGGTASITADLGSGKVELLDSSRYSKPEMFGDFPNTSSSVAAVEEAILTDVSGFSGQFGYSGAEYIGSVTYAESDVYFSSGGQTELYWEYAAGY